MPINKAEQKSKNSLLNMERFNLKLNIRDCLG
jgi:hypothetical protein